MKSRFGGRFPATAIAWVDGIVERTQERGIYARQALIALENNACHPYGLCDGKMTSCFYEGLDELLCDRPALFHVRDRGLPFSVLNLIPLQRELGLVQPKLMLGELFDFPLHRRRRPLQSPLPYPNEGRSARSWSFVAQPGVPIECALFCRRSSQALSVESPATAPVLRLTPQPSWIATGRFAPPSLGRT
jgi:hypothetical protein